MEQFRAVGLLIRPTVAIAGALALVTMVVIGIEALRVGESIELVPELALFTAPIALLLPFAVWKGEYRFRRSYLAAMPVDRTRHVLTKLAAGWAWLMVMTAVFVLLMLALTLVTGGSIGFYTRVLEGDVPPGATPEQVAALARRLSAPAWQWAVFIPGATVMYLFGSAIVLASRRTKRWLAGVAVGYLTIRFVSDDVMDLNNLAERLNHVVITILEGTYGLETLVAGRGNPTDLANAVGEYVVSVWPRPTIGLWLVTTLLWVGIAVATVAAVVSGDRKD